MATSTNRFINFLDELPTSEVRILMTILLIFGTGMVYLFHVCSNTNPITHACIGYEPSSNWLIFLSAMAGVDITQYMTRNIVDLKQAQITANTTNSQQTPNNNTQG